ncbi:unnamed protein product [Ranitomeya imitator]|uniref:Uncharacterized protein n=1 Tax=Ranitomeya imitator TaxID=111125 RepID=A0ABN9LYY3_9NEOB|nr:unnamed protein product [Ranitomeya imitator]
MQPVDLENSPMFANDLDCQKISDGSHEIPSLTRKKIHDAESSDEAPEVHSGGAFMRWVEWTNKVLVGVCHPDPGHTTIEKYDLRTNS